MLEWENKKIENLINMKRTHSCGELSFNNLGKDVVLCGWVHSRRDHGGLIFIDLRDTEGITQIVFNPETEPLLHKHAHNLKNEFVISVSGKVSQRPEGTMNPKIPTGGIEILTKHLEILNPSKPLPFEVNEETLVSEDLRLTYRFLDLRREKMHNIIILRSEVFKIIRDSLHNQKFIEIETPMLTKSTPEGARDYLVPSRLNEGMFYALPQSPQLFKQVLMVAGFDKYYQIVKCFRDEDLRKDRQPEFTQLDIEMSFVLQDDIFSLMENLIAEIFDQVFHKKLAVPFPRITYQNAMQRYGSDKPDLRYGMELFDLSSLALQSGFLVFQKTFKAQGRILSIKADSGAKFSLKELDELINFAIDCGAKGLVWIKVLDDGFQSPVRKHLGNEFLVQTAKLLSAKPGDLILIVADAAQIALNVLGRIRIFLAEKQGITGNNEFNFLWVTDFPLFKYSQDEQRWNSEHHPFTAPKEEDLGLLENNEFGKVRSSSYDLVLNGAELASGSVRIHKPELQDKIFKILSMDEDSVRDKFGFLMKAFSYGAPPHAGIALGLDRLLTLLTGSSTIRDVIAFPKNQKAICPLTSAPSKVTAAQLSELNLTIKER